jgi:hypothetical protein
LMMLAKRIGGKIYDLRFMIYDLEKPKAHGWSSRRWLGFKS